MTEEFENVFREYAEKHVTGATGLVMKIASYFYEVRQPEIDALIHDNASLYKSLNGETNERCRLEEENAALKTRVERLLQALAGVDFAAATTPPAQEVEPVAYLANGCRFKLSFSERGNVSCFSNYRGELDGRWVALVGAENDAHLKIAASHADDNLRKAAEEVLDAYSKTDPEIQGELFLAIEELRTALEEK